MKKRYLSILFLSSLFAICSCSAGENNVSSNSESKELEIHLNGEVANTIEVNSSFSDPGVFYPDGFTLVTDGSVVTTKVGKYELIYSVYSSDGELIKEMHRFVNVVDTTAPVFTPNNSINEYKVGKYQLADFISSYSDNYDKNVNVSSTSFDLIPGNNKITITFTDSSGNSSTFEKTVTATFDMEKVIRDAYQNQPSKITTGSTGMGSNYLNVRIDSNTSLMYYDSGTLHFTKTVSTALSSRASIQISAEYGKFNKADVDYHVGSGTPYSVGFATIDATNKNATVRGFTSTINNLNLDTNLMLSELNAALPSVLEEFQTYMKDTLKLELK